MQGRGFGITPVALSQTSMGNKGGGYKGGWYRVPARNLSIPIDRPWGRCMAGGGVHGVQGGGGIPWRPCQVRTLHPLWTMDNSQADKYASFLPSSHQLPSLFTIIAYLIIIYNMSRETTSPLPCSSDAAPSNIESPLLVLSGPPSPASSCSSGAAPSGIESPQPLLADRPSPTSSPNPAATVASYPVPTSPSRYFSVTAFSDIESPPSPAPSATTFGGRLNPSATVAAHPVSTPEPCKSLDVRMGQAPG